MLSRSIIVVSLLLTLILPIIAAGQDRDKNCDNSTGTQFNLQGVNGAPELGFAVPQMNPSVDFIPRGGVNGADLVIGGAWDMRGRFNDFDVPITFPPTPVPNAWGYGQSAYYVHRSGHGCSPDFEGALPSIPGTYQFLLGFHQVSVAVDATRGMVYAADERAWPFQVGGIGLFKTTAANMDNPGICAPGTHNTDANGADAAAARCWPVRTLLDPTDSSNNQNEQEPELRADERLSGVGAGDLYITYLFCCTTNGQGISNTEVRMVACPYTFSSVADCSKPITLSGDEFGPAFPEVNVRPDGIVTLTYTSFTFNGFSQDLNYVSCVPHGAPNPPTCTTRSIVAAEERTFSETTQTMAHKFTVWTKPSHAERFNPATGKYEVFVAWANCGEDPEVPVGQFAFLADCPDANVVMAYSPTDDAGNALAWSPVIPVNTHIHDQVIPTVRSDRETNLVHIVYYSSENDLAGELLQLMESRVEPDSYAAGPPIALAKTLFDPMADFFLQGGGPEGFGDLIIGTQIGIAARSGRTYVHSVATSVPGIFGNPGTLNSGYNNLLTRTSH